MGPKAPCEAFGEADAVFSGQVISINTQTSSEHRGLNNRLVSFLVKESFRGVNSPELEVTTGMGGGDCGFSFEIGKEYLVYAYLGEEKRLSTGICTRTGLLTKVNEDLGYIRGRATAEPNATLNGTILRRKQGPDGIPDQSAMADVKVIVQGQGKEYEALSNESGKFSIQGIAAGTYKVKLSLPVGLASGSNEQEVKLSEKGCAAVYFVVVSDGRLIGVVFDAAGQPFEKAEIILMEFGKEKYRGYMNHAYSDEEGKYEFSQLPPGRYVLQIRFDGLTSQTSPFPTLYYPNTSDPKQASVIDIADGQIIDKFNLYLPAVPKEYLVEGAVVRPDGQPFADARVEYSSEAVSYSAKVDAGGQFSFKAYEGVTVSVRAVFENKDKHLYSEWVRVNSAIKLKLVVPF
jgi:hypothetical protein